MRPSLPAPFAHELPSHDHRWCPVRCATARDPAPGRQRKRGGSVMQDERSTQEDQPKSWDGTLWASGERPSTRVALTETTPSCCCRIPSTRRNGSVTSVRRWRAKRCGVTITFRSEEHTSELQSQSNLVCRLLLEKKKKKIQFR